MEFQEKECETPSPGLSSKHVVIRLGYCSGTLHIAGHRIKVQHIAVWHGRMGLSPEEIAVAHPGITLADVYAALAYYYDHREQIDADIEADQRFIAEQMEKAGPSKLQQRLAGNS